MSEQLTQLRIKSFEGQILYFNGMYKLPVAPMPSLSFLNEPVEDRLEKFRETLLKEIKELDDILLKVVENDIRNSQQLTELFSEEEILTDIADWLGDIQIYCASEMAKFGIPIQETLRIIMQSNFSKLQADGTVKYDENGKVEKGPGYWKPEPLIKDMLLARIEDATGNKNSGERNE